MKRAPVWLAAFGVVLVCLWPPDGNLANKLVNWSVDPPDKLPVLPEPVLSQRPVEPMITPPARSS